MKFLQEMIEYGFTMPLGYLWPVLCNDDCFSHGSVRWYWLNFYLDT